MPDSPLGDQDAAQSASGQPQFAQSASGQPQFPCRSSAPDPMKSDHPLVEELPILRSSTPKRKQWTPSEDALLEEAVRKLGPSKWTKIAECVPHRETVQCMQRWKHALDPALTKGPWSTEEDRLLKEAMQESGHQNWSEIATRIPNRNAKQCRERWNTALNTTFKRSAWTPQEDKVRICFFHTIELHDTTAGTASRCTELW